MTFLLEQQEKQPHSVTVTVNPSPDVVPPFPARPPLASHTVTDGPLGAI